ncbi:exodeoxyribonuclease VII large subunit [Nocardioides sp. TRM66260-LWL]|uniref:exodeoxyribonuclease VII large subunit n=1 Tax=Nocardioides sp. TRM66260-LWL TaxID=2874478 RepID=UPI001CC5F55B|nr:exodeoxyribonuclease VII large subunit [Nocardioides sp. TRM66260-LWL]MBZ5736195.1 exodeoxyribonuclease VII large subunit [Nocardioides sp. TRM66260-LWL]
MALETSPSAPAPVRQIAMLISGYVDRLGAVWVEGQVAQLNRRPGLATVFLTLRDAVADISIPVTAQRVYVDSLNPPLVEGASVVVHAKPSYYAARGTLSLQAREIRMVGLGELLAQIERRRQLLAAEGLFAAELKRRPPFLPRRVGLVTAPNSAAERDVVENARRRWPGVVFETAYATMQGPRCAGEVIDALERLERHPEVDVVVVARGGGAVEDLLPFSDEGLLRAVHRLRTPVVSAIGHEPDSPLLDLVADVRASTPTDAGRLVVPDVAEEARGVEAARQRLRGQLAGLLHREDALLAALRSRPALADPRSLVDRRLEELAALRERSRRTVRHRLERAADDVESQRLRARALSPLEVLRRGYAVLQDADGHVVASVAGVAPPQSLSARVADGRLALAVTAVEETDA